MEIINNSSCSFAWITGQISSNYLAATFIIKASFNISIDGRLIPIEESEPPIGDVFVDDDPDCSCLYESDFVLYKPRTDLIFTGKCYTPNRQPTKVCQVLFQVGAYSKTLLVFGDRYWRRTIAGSRTMTEPEPFTEMALVWERSFGGPNLKDNPHGKGSCEIDDGHRGRFWPLPNIEDPSCLIKTIKDRPKPAGFGSLGRTWPIRMDGRIGSYDDEWLKNEWPWFPADFDWSYFNSASPELQVEGYLQGDEQVFLRNLHPDEAEFHFNLPGLRPRFFICHLGDGSDCSFHEVNLRLDTIWVDMNNDMLHLIWRGNRQIQNEKMEEISHCFITAEELEGDSLPQEHYKDLFLKQLQQEPNLSLPDDMPEFPDLDDSWLQDLEESFIQMEEKLNKLDAQMDKAEKKAIAMLQAAGTKSDKVVEVKSGLSAKEKLTNAAIRYEKLISEMLKERPELKDLLPSIMSDEEIEDLDDIEIESLPEFAPFPEPLTRRECKERLEKGLDLTGEDLSGLDLSGLDFSGASCQDVKFEGADLSGAIFSGANLAGAGLSGCNLSGLNLKGANLSEADATGADFTGADLTGAILDYADMSGCKMRKAILKGVQAVSTLFSGSDLGDADMREAVLRESDLEGVVLDRVDLRRADLREASLEKAKGHEMNMQEADLTALQAGGGADFSGSIFVKINGTDSIWEQAVLYGSDFSGAFLERANFMEAELVGVKFIAADLKEARLDNADLSGALMISANLFKGCLEGALLSNVDMRMANLYEVEFYNVKIEHVLFQGANLKMTKLAHLETEGLWKS